MGFVNKDLENVGADTFFTGCGSKAKNSLALNTTDLKSPWEECLDILFPI